mmetsp:Transcript_2101/g.5916  ORF Transcript_2101/g.5916 Transcript_2101/m.5916 type:complete len:215 (-) Transcript_2101:920-1564(-)
MAPLSSQRLSTARLGFIQELKQVGCNVIRSVRRGTRARALGHSVKRVGVLDPSAYRLGDLLWPLRVVAEAVACHERHIARLLPRQERREHRRHSADSCLCDGTRACFGDHHVGTLHVVAHLLDETAHLHITRPPVHLLELRAQLSVLAAHGDHLRATGTLAAELLCGRFHNLAEAADAITAADNEHGLAARVEAELVVQLFTRPRRFPERWSHR